MSTLFFWIWVIISLLMAIWVYTAKVNDDGKGNDGLSNRMMAPIIMFIFWPVIILSLIIVVIYKVLVKKEAS